MSEPIVALQTTRFSARTTPAIPGFHPDPTICRVGVDYYLATSSFEYFPGVPVFHSTDLVSWTQIGHVLTRRSQFREGEGLPSAGIYAGTLRHHGGRFYYITTNADDLASGHFIVTAERPDGDWSEPVHIPQALGIDPDLCWDEEDRCLLTWHVLDFSGTTSAVRQAIVDPATGHLLSHPVDVWQGSGLPAAEGPHLYRIGQWWYLVLAEGGTERGHCVTIARAPRPEGPYEPHPDNPILTRRSTFEPVVNTGHADLVELADGSWAAVYLGVRPAGSTPGFHVLGRETFLAGVDWVDGWPVLVPDRFELPAPSTEFSDDFSGEVLDHRWVVPAGDLSTIERLPSGLRVTAGGLLCCRVRDLRWTAEVTLLDAGGFSLRIDPRHSYSLEVTEGEFRAVARIGDLTAVVGSLPAPGREVTLRIAAVDPGTAPVPIGHAGPDDIVLSVVIDGGAVELARLDGRYLSTEVASGFTGRMLALGSEDTATTVLAVAYTAP